MLYLHKIEPSPVPSVVRDMVKEVFCDQERARYGPYELLDEGQQVLKDTLYEFTVADDLRTYHLQLFTAAKGVSGMIWEQEIRTMMRISRLGHPSLPDVITGGYEETPTDRDDFAFVITPKPEARLNEPGEMERIRGDKREALWQFGMLSDALSKLHWHGVMHRNLWPGTIERYTPVDGTRTSGLRLVRFEMSAFIENIFRRFTADQEESDVYSMHEVVRRFIIGEGINALACCAPERLHLLSSSGDTDPEGTAETDRSDVYSLGVLASQWFFDREGFDERYLAKAFGGGKIDLDGAESFRKSIIDSLRRTKILPKGLRRLLESMMEPDWLDRPTSQKVCDVISRNYENWSLEWSDDVKSDPRLVAYLPDEMSRTVFRWNWVSHDPGTGTDPIASRLVSELIEDDLRNGSLVYSPEGFVPFAEREETGPMHGARHVLLGKRAGWFCEMYYPNNRRDLDPWGEILLIKYVARRDGPRGSKVNDLYKTLFRQRVGALEIRPSTAGTFDLLKSRRRGRPSWEQMLEEVAARTPRQESRLEFERAVEFLLKYFNIELQARMYPFTKEADDGVTAKLKVNEDMDDYRKQKSDSALFTFYMNKGGTEPRPYFGDFFRSSQTYEDGDWTVEYFADRGGFPEWKKLGNAIVLDQGEFSDVYLKVPTDAGAAEIPKVGWLAPARDASRREELRRQRDAIQEILLLGSLLGQIRDPQTIRTLRGPWKEAGKDLKDDDPKVEGKHGQFFVQELLTCQPFYALHGPPGTGKTTVVSRAIAALLEREPTARVLVSAQSNFALDNLGERIAALLKDSGKILRVTSPASDDKVSDRMKKYLASELTTSVVKKITSNCESEIKNLHKSGHHEFAKLAREWLDNIESSKPDLQERIRAAANVVLATCSGSTKLHIDRAAGSSLFDWVIVEEAARAWPTELAIPLIRGFRWALVGDHKQLPAHRIREIEQFLNKCSESDNLDEIRRHWLDREKYMEVYRFFGQMFGKLENNVATGIHTRRKYEPPLGQMRKQFRMRKPIADVVSDSFYKVPPLLTSPKTEKAIRFNKPSFLHDGRAVVWIDTSGSSSYDDERCWKNRGEARVIRDLLVQMEPFPRVGQEPFSRNPLAIISPYRQQNDLIIQELRSLVDKGKGSLKKRLEVADLARPDVVHSVHSIQGREADVVIGSLVRSGAGYGSGAYGKLGHVADPALVNVLLSRAKLLLILVGNLTFFETSGEGYPLEAGFWRDVCSSVRKNARVLSVEDLYANYDF
jgi:hypothetical protein